MVTYDDMEKTATKRMVKIKGKIVYEPKGKGLIKITKCSGSWKPSSKSIYIFIVSPDIFNLNILC